MNRGFPVTDPHLDAPDGTVVDGYERCGSWWYPLEKEESMDFGQALAAIKQGKRVARKGWNGKGMWLVLIRAGNAMHSGFDMQDCIGMKTAQNMMQPGWLASQNDMLAEDWEVVGE